MAETRIAFDDAAAYDRYMGRWSKAIGEKFLAWLDPPQNRHWLDVGCGTGAFTELVLAQAAPKKVIGIDPSPSQVEHATRAVTARQADFRIGTAIDLPFGAGAFDVVVSALVIHFVPDRPKAFREMLRVTKPGGIIGGYTWRKSPTIIDAPYGPLARGVTEIGGDVMSSPTVSEAMPDGLRATLTAEGYQDIEITTIEASQTFRDFEDYWMSQTGTFPHPVAKSVAALSDHDRERLRDHLRSALPAAADGSITYSARATAFKARKAQRPADMNDEMTEHAPVDSVDWTPEADLQDMRDRERELIERALRASEERFQTAFYSSPMAMAITTLAEGRYVDVNEAFERQMDYGRAELIGRTTLELNVWPSPSDRAAMISRLQRERTLRDQNIQFRTKSGRLITTLYTVALISIAGQPCVLAAIEDITAQKQAEEALRASESKFRLLAETTLCGIFIYRRDGTFCYFNPQVEAFTGYSAQELRSLTVWDLIHPDSKDVARTRAEARWRGEAVPARYQFKLVTKDGGPRWVDFTATPTVFDGEPVILGTAFDITANKRHEQEAKEHTAFLQALIANSPFGILVGGKDHRARFCNPAFERIFLYSEDEVVGKEPDELVGVPEDADAAEYSRRVMSGQSVHGTALRRRKDGSLVNVDFHAMPLIVGDAFVGCVGIYQDITERVESEAKLAALRDRLTRVQDDERARIARELHDDLGQRLALLTIQLSELEQASLDLAPSLAEQLETSRRLSEEICAEANLLSHRLHPSRLAHIGLTNALSRLCDEFAQQGSMDIDFHHDEIPELPSEVTTCLYRVAQEAIRNAEKHSGSRRVRVELAARSDSILLCVSDSGRGFAATSVECSTGLGLVSMAERVRSMGGALSVQSEVNRGTRIEASIPLPTES